MLGGINPKQMQAMMRKMGISQDEILASRVIIEKKDGGRLIIDKPDVLKIKMQGQTSFQITGEEKEENFNEEDIETIIKKTGTSRNKAIETLKKTGDLAEAILELS